MHLQVQAVRGQARGQGHHRLRIGAPGQVAREVEAHAAHAGPGESRKFDFRHLGATSATLKPR